jgi:hypothetical protein
VLLSPFLCAQEFEERRKRPRQKTTLPADLVWEALCGPTPWTPTSGAAQHKRSKHFTRALVGCATN